MGLNAQQIDQDKPVSHGTTLIWNPKHFPHKDQIAGKDVALTSPQFKIAYDKCNADYPTYKHEINQMKNGGAAAPPPAGFAPPPAAAGLPPPGVIRPSGPVVPPSFVVPPPNMIPLMSAPPIMAQTVPAGMPPFVASALNIIKPPTGLVT